jgi:REP element-mobilizing transposase RayT
MGLKNRISEGNIYFLTMTVVDWVDIFTRPAYKLEIVRSLKYCQQYKGLEIFAWCLMSNHLHIIAAAKEGQENTLSDILRDFKKFTSKEMIRLIMEENESRRKWLLDRFEFAGRNDRKIKNYKFWQDGNEAKEIHTNAFLQQKIDYIHDNPVRQMLVREPQDFIFSSAINYSGGKGLLDVILVD